MNNSNTNDHTSSNDSEVEGFALKSDDVLGIAVGRRQHLPIVTPIIPTVPTVPGFITPESGQDL